MNFGETLGYWYLRLNGFIPMANFVLHEFDVPQKHNADTDLLAVRLPHVFEEVGGQKGDWDTERFDAWELDHERHIVFVVCEVKTGRFTADSINSSFSEQRILYALRRFGAMPEEGCATICRRLMNSAVVIEDGFTFAKVLMCSAENHNGSPQGMTPCCKIELAEALNFIRERLGRYSHQKNTTNVLP